MKYKVEFYWSSGVLFEEHFSYELELSRVPNKGEHIVFNHGSSKAKDKVITGEVRSVRTYFDGKLETYKVFLNV